MIIMVSTVLKRKYNKMPRHIHVVAVTSSFFTSDNESLMVRGAADGIYVKFKLINPCVAGPYIIKLCATRTVYN